VGSNATILPAITIGHRSTIGAGSVVTNDLPDDVRAFGNPARNH
jgi:maltose O-acetyltransferase